MKPISLFDEPVILDASVTPIPASDQPPLQVVASLPFDVARVRVVDAIGQYMALYEGPVGREKLVHVFGNRHEITFRLEVPKASRLSVRSLSTEINSGTMCCSFYAE